MLRDELEKILAHCCITEPFIDVEGAIIRAAFQTGVLSKQDCELLCKKFDKDISCWLAPDNAFYNL